MSGAFQMQLPPPCKGQPRATGNAQRTPAAFFPLRAAVLQQSSLWTLLLAQLNDLVGFDGLRPGATFREEKGKQILYTVLVSRVAKETAFPLKCYAPSSF